jgi:threonyl-tRNA synthetase
MERFVAVLIEHTAGKFPLWLTPDQAVVLPISEKSNEYAWKVKEMLEAQDVRVIVDDRNEKIGRKIRDNELKRIPYMVIVGEKEAAEGTVAVRPQGGGEQSVKTIQEFIDEVNARVAEMTKDF